MQVGEKVRQKVQTNKNLERQIEENQEVEEEILFDKFENDRVKFL